MVKRGKMQRVVMRVLSVMLVASFLLAVLSFVWSKPVSAEYYYVCDYWTCGYCVDYGNNWCTMFYKWKIVQGTGWHCTDTVCDVVSGWCGDLGCP